MRRGVPARDPRIDAYIARSADFAQPVLTHFREVVHAACPEVEETLKWGAPTFMYRGMLCGMASFKAHCAFNFWRGDLVFGDDAPAPAGGERAMGQFGRVTRIEELPPVPVLTRYVQRAMALNEGGAKPPRPRRSAGDRARELAVPDDLAAALRGNASARATFEALAPSQRREYAEWIADAKRDATRQRRLATALEWLGEGKPRNWKYVRG